MHTQVEELSDSRVRLTIDVSRDEVKHAVEHAASDLAGSLKIPGFRKGKVPIPVLVARVGKERLFAEAVQTHIGGWFWNAAARSRIHPVAQPEYDFELPASDREDWRFSATVDVQPMPDVADWTTLEVPRAEARIPDDAVEHELDLLRSTVAQLAPVEGRPAVEGDTVVLDVVRPSGEAVQRDYVVELGSGQLLDEIERAVVGMSAGETATVEFEVSDDATGTVEVTLKEIKEKVLPPLDDELARTASEFETLAELRASIEQQLLEQAAEEAETAFRAAVVDRLVEASKVEAAGPLVESRTRELVAALARSVERRGISLETYLAVTGGTPDELVERMRAEARQSVARELVLEAVARRVDVDVSDEELVEALREQAGPEENVDEAVEALRESGRLEALRNDLRLRKALDRVAAEVKPIPVELAEARERLWTPEKEKTPTDTKLWTPSSKEP